MKKTAAIILGLILPLAAAASEPEYPETTVGTSSADSVLVDASELSSVKRGKNGRRPVKLGLRLKRDTTDFTRRSLRTHLIIPKGEWQIGMTAAYMNMSSDNSEFLLLIDDTYASASIVRLTLHGSFAYLPNQALGLRFQYTNGGASVDAATLDLLGNFSFDVKNVKANTQSWGASVYNRSYLGLDEKGRVGLFLDVALGYTKSRSSFQMGDPSSNYTTNDKINLALSPGLVYFPMNNISLFLSLSLAEASYNYSKAVNDGVVTGARRYFKAQAQVNLLSLNFGLAVHL
ncbi:MAG: hypothetical protein ACI39U_07415 [Candidatus Cryptobacteroides sp.]